MKVNCGFKNTKCFGWGLSVVMFVGTNVFLCHTEHFVAGLSNVRNFIVIDRRVVLPVSSHLQQWNC